MVGLLWSVAMVVAKVNEWEDWVRQPQVDIPRLEKSDHKKLNDIHCPKRAPRGCECDMTTLLSADSIEKCPYSKHMIRLVHTHFGL